MIAVDSRGTAVRVSLLTWADLLGIFLTTWQRARIIDAAHGRA